MAFLVPSLMKPSLNTRVQTLKVCYRSMESDKARCSNLVCSLLNCMPSTSRYSKGTSTFIGVEMIGDLQGHHFISLHTWGSIFYLSDPQLTFNTTFFLLNARQYRWWADIRILRTFTSPLPTPPFARHCQQLMKLISKAKM